MATLHVDTTGNNSNNGSSSMPFKDLSYAEGKAEPEDKILLTSGQTHEVTQDSEMTLWTTPQLELTSSDVTNHAILHFHDSFTPSNTNHGLIEISADDSNIHDMTFKARNFGNTSTQGLRAITSDNISGTGLTYSKGLIQHVYFDNLFDPIHTNYVNNMVARHCIMEVYTVGFHQNAIVMGNNDCLAEFNKITWNNTLPGRANDQGGIRMGVNSNDCVVRYNYISGLKVDNHGSFTNGRNSGIFAEGTNVYVHNNTIYDMILPDGGVMSGVDESGGIIIGALGTAKVFSNIVSSTSRAFTVLTGGVASHESHNCFSGGSALFGHTADSTSITQDPQFTNSGSGDLSLIPTSRCRNYGLGQNNMGADRSRPPETAGLLAGV